ncbi:uncharacterized protein LOC111338245 [Stylophora pistillata]|uniref:uncharacterized protein LOC111338245 n=1 Tax=Stylophora pistillata TaxID=50429 RepID=UPI000C03C55F|nr:uncharacterized protein LOC111338245 [Stylophora pistillata]
MSKPVEAMAFGKVTHGIVKDTVVKNHKPLLNGDFEFLGRQNRSSSECSSDSNLETLLEEADKIHSSKNGFRKDTPAKKQVRFNMERNQEYSYNSSEVNNANDSNSSLKSAKINGTTDLPVVNGISIIVENLW